MSLRDEIQNQVKTAMRAKDRERLSVLRMVTAAIKQKEVDERTELEDNDVLAILEKMVKQRRESIEQYREGGRDELADKEAAELEVLKDFLPEPLSDDELDALIDEAVADTGAESMADMGKVMGRLKSKAQGRADMGEVSKKVKARLGS